MAEFNVLPEAELLFRVLGLIGPLSVSLRRQMYSYLRKETHIKRDFLVMEGDVARKVYFIVQGFARSFFVDGNGYEHTKRFMGKMDIMVSVYSFFTQQPSPEYLEILDNSVLLSITWDQLQTIYGEHPEFNYHARILTEKYYIQAEERAILYRTQNAQERYRLFIEKYPDDLQQATLGQIASFLGVTQETLSRIRAQRHI